MNRLKTGDLNDKLLNTEYTQLENGISNLLDNLATRLFRSSHAYTEGEGLG